MNNILRKIIQRMGEVDLVKKMTSLSGSEFNSLILEIFKQRAENISATGLLQTFEQNRFVHPADINTIESMELGLNCLKLAHKNGFKPITLSPVCPIGTCSAFGTVSQNKVISGLRGTEVVADSTNVLALQLSQDFKKGTNKYKVVHYSTVHRLIRGQHYNNPSFLPHFSSFCLASGGLDTGHFEFEITQLNRHIAVLLILIKTYFPDADPYLKFYLKSHNEQLENLLKQESSAYAHLKYSIVRNFDSQYYQTVQYKIFVSVNSIETNIIDGGFVNWTQRLLGNQKHRLMISGAGIELMLKMLIAARQDDQNASR